MPYVEYWKSKPRWRELTPKQQAFILNALTRLVRENVERTDETCGPFLHHQARMDILIWHVLADRAMQLKKAYKKLLDDDFEPVLYGSGEELTAQDYFDQLRGGPHGP